MGKRAIFRIFVSFFRIFLLHTIKESYMKKRMCILLAVAMALSGGVIAQSLEGFAYGRQTAPSGREWESPEELSLGKEQPHAWFFTFATDEEARQFLPEKSSYYQSLNGTWQFHWVGNPSERPADFYKTTFDASHWDRVEVPMNWNVYGLQNDGSQKYGTPIYVNQPVIFKHTVAVDDWRGGVMREPEKHHTTYKNRNEVGSYRRTFTMPQNWAGRQIYINFDGVDSFFYLWINGEYVGFSKNSRNLASFDITDFLTKGENLVAVEVYRSSDASFLESQDMFRLPGIFRSVSLTATHKIQIRDLRVRTRFDEHYCDAEAQVEVELRNLTEKSGKGYMLHTQLYKNELYGDQTELIPDGKSSMLAPELIPQNTETLSLVLPVKKPAKWSAEEPNRYTLLVKLCDKKGRTVETVSTIFGFREVEIRDTEAQDDEFGLAGRYYYLNGKPIKMKGVNRHETNLETGHVISRKQMLEEIMLMKRGNINHVRCSHYPDDPYWYYLCDKYGIYLENEANIESHEYYYGDASLSHVPEFRKAHVARVMEMAAATINHPSVVIWSLGNEGGPGDNFKAAYEALHRFDPSRPVQYERNNNIVDMGSNQYPSIAWVQHAVKGEANIKYPFHISEYAHSMGNAGGNLQDYWTAIESSNFLMGGAIWDWVDQAFWNVDPKTGTRYMGYGGDFGDRPNDHTFCMNGVMFPDLSPKPFYFEVKKVYQDVGIAWGDARKIKIFNKRYFMPLDDLFMRVTLWENGVKVQSVQLDDVRIEPRQTQEFACALDLAKLNPQHEYFVKVQLCQKQDRPWAKRGYAQMEEQLLLQTPTRGAALQTEAYVPKQLQVIRQEGKTLIEGGECPFSMTFDDQKGVLAGYVYDHATLFEEGASMSLSTYRAPVDNDNWAWTRWYDLGLCSLKDQVLSMKTEQLSNGTVVLQYLVRSQGEASFQRKKQEDNSFKLVADEPLADDDFAFTSNRIWTIYPDGSVELNSSVTGSDSSVDLARIGYQMQLPKRLNRIVYYGRGPQNNYNDRCSGAFVERFDTSVADQFVAFPKPQDMANREDVRWYALMDQNDHGLLFVASDRLSMSALAWNDKELTEAGHPYELPYSSATWLHVDQKVTGLGGNSCGQGGPFEEHRVKSGVNNVCFMLRPLKRGDDLQKRAAVEASGVNPVALTRDIWGFVSMTSSDDAAQICYRIGQKGKTQHYTEPFDLSQGGTITVWEQANPSLTVEYHYDEVRTIPVTVKYTSSEEMEYPASNLLDGDPSTMWHTTYSITVAQYPHYVDLDAGKQQEIRGFKYLPRQDGYRTGNVKGYRVEVSADCKTWSEAVVEGEFADSTKLQTVLFEKPVTARYFRFIALSAQDGQDYASGVSLELIRQ